MTDLPDAVADLHSEVTELLNAIYGLFDRREAPLGIAHAACMHVVASNFVDLVADDAEFEEVLAYTLRFIEKKARKAWSQRKPASSPVRH